MKDSNFFTKVYGVVKQIPPGRVTTYGEIARILRTKDARKVGFALHANTNKDCPCHRVVNREGRVASNFAFDGAREQKRRLLKEGVEFKDKTRVDLEKCRWLPE